MTSFFHSCPHSLVGSLVRVCDGWKTFTLPLFTKNLQLNVYKEEREILHLLSYLIQNFVSKKEKLGEQLIEWYSSRLLERNWKLVKVIAVWVVKQIWFANNSYFLQFPEKRSLTGYLFYSICCGLDKLRRKYIHTTSTMGWSIKYVTWMERSCRLCRRG